MCILCHVFDIYLLHVFFILTPHHAGRRDGRLPGFFEWRDGEGQGSPKVRANGNSCHVCLPDLGVCTGIRPFIMELFNGHPVMEVREILANPKRRLQLLKSSWHYLLQWHTRVEWLPLFCHVLLGDTKETIWRSLSRDEDVPSRGPLYFLSALFHWFSIKDLDIRMGVPEPHGQSMVSISPEGMNLLWFMHVTSTKVGGSLVQLSMCRSPWSPRGTRSVRHAMMAVWCWLLDVQGTSYLHNFPTTGCNCHWHPSEKDAQEWGASEISLTLLWNGHLNDHAWWRQVDLVARSPRCHSQRPHPSPRTHVISYHVMNLSTLCLLGLMLE